jgi:hypothetical protein
MKLSAFNKRIRTKLKQMISLKECRKILGEKYMNCTDEEIISIRDWLTELAKIAEEAIERRQLEEMEYED